MKNFKQRDVNEILASSQEPDIDGVIIIDEQGVIQSFDNAAQNLFVTVQRKLSISLLLC